MALLVESAQSTSVNGMKIASSAGEPPNDDSGTQEGAETDISWEVIKEECHDLLEQLPLTLQRNFKLIRDLDEQVSAHLHAIPDVLQDYLHLRNTSQHDAQMADTVESPDTERDKRPISRASFSSASLTPITESPSVRSLSLPNPRLFHDDSTNAADEDDEEETEEQETSFESQLPAPVPLTSTQLIARVAALAADAVRGSLEKVNLSNAAYTLIDRHVRALDLAIAEQESVINLGLRPGTKPSALVIPCSSPTHSQSHSVESAKLFALAEVASAIHAGEKTLDTMQSMPTESTMVHTWNGDEQESPQENTSPIIRGSKNADIAHRPQQNKRERRKKSNIVQQEEIPDPNEPVYCYCQRVSFGKMIACDGPNCKREWFHWECVGITREPTASKWYCRDCRDNQSSMGPAKKKRRR